MNTSWDGGPPTIASVPRLLSKGTNNKKRRPTDDGGTRRPPRIMREGAKSTPRRLRTAGHQPGALGFQLRGTGHRQEGQSGAQEETTPGLRPERIGRRATDTAGSSLNIQDLPCGHGLGGRGFGQNRMTSSQAPGKKPPPCLRSRATSASTQIAGASPEEQYYKEARFALNTQNKKTRHRFLLPEGIR